MIGSLIAGLISQGGANTASNMYSSAANQAQQNARQGAFEARQAATPYTVPGFAAMREITNLLGLGTLNPQDQFGGTSLNEVDREGQQKAAFDRFKVSPDYQFRFREGVNALDRSAASRGMLFSGAQMRGAQEFGQDLASTEYGNYFNRLAGVGGQGAQSTAAATNAATSSLINGNNAFMAGTGGAANAYMQGQNALASGISSGVNNMLTLGALWGMGGFGKGSSYGGAPKAVT